MKRFFVTLSLLLLIAIGSSCCPRNVVVYEQTPPPLLKAEVIAVRPCPRAVWVPGYWVWRGKHRGYVWVPGYWRR